MSKPCGARTEHYHFVSEGAKDSMANLTIRMDPQEKGGLMAWGASDGTNATDYVKAVVAADMAAGTPPDRAAAWLRGNEAEATYF
jgi:hypothetical protein